MVSTAVLPPLMTPLIVRSLRLLTVMLTAVVKVGLRVMRTLVVLVPMKMLPASWMGLPPKV